MSLWIAVLVFILKGDVQMVTIEAESQEQCVERGKSAVEALVHSGIELEEFIVAQCVSVKKEGDQI